MWVEIAGKVVHCMDYDYVAVRSSFHNRCEG